MKKKRNLAEEVVMTHEIAEIFGCTPRWVNELTNGGVIVQVERGKYHLGETIRRYIASIKQQAEEKDKEETDLREEQTMLTRANRKMAELELAVMNGDLHRSEDVKDIMNEMLAAFRSRLLAIPARLAPEITAANDPMVAQQLIKGEIYDALSELSEYDPAKFKSAEVAQGAEVVVSPGEGEKTESAAVKKSRVKKNNS